jgi:hypothetical protein
MQPGASQLILAHALSIMRRRPPGLTDDLSGFPKQAGAYCIQPQKSTAAHKRRLVPETSRRRSGTKKSQARQAPTG